MDNQIIKDTHHYANIMFEHMPVGVALYDAKDLHLLAANTLYHRFLNNYLPTSWRKGQAVGIPLREWLPKEETIDFVNIFRTVAETGIPYRVDEYAFYTPECGTTYWNWSLDPIYDETGTITSLLVTATQVSTQVRARQEAEQANTSLHEANSFIERERKRLEIIEAVAGSVRKSLDTERISMAAIDAIRSHFNTMYVYTHIADGGHHALRLLHICPTLDNYSAFREVQYVPYDSSYPVARAYKHRDPIVMEDLQAAAHAGSIASDNRLVTSGGRGYICVPLWFGDQFEGTLSAVFKDTIRPDGPEVEALVGCSTHIAAAFAHARLLASVENERARLKAVLDQLPEGVVITEVADGCVSYANAAAAELLGIARTQLIGNPLNRYPQSHMVMDLNGRPVLPWNFTIVHALCGETVSGQETMVIRPDGSNIVTLSSAAPIRLENGVIVGAAVIFQDITRKKSLEQQKNEFLSIASHELRTPITALMGYAEILQMQASEGQPLDSAGMRAIRSIVEQSECLTRLIEEMLDISRIEHAQLGMNLAPHDLLKTMLSVIENQASTTKKHRFQLVLEGLERTDTLIGYFDEERIVQVLNNLISNAIKYSPGGSEIEVGLRATLEKPDEVLLWVKDDGIGIASDELPHIFERFHRASNFDHSISGLGIGLYLVDELVKQHGGHVWVESVEGKGSTFYVTLPLKNRL